MALIAQFLTQVRQYVSQQNGELLQAWLEVAPEAGQSYRALASELQQLPNQKLAESVEKALDKLNWPGFTSLMIEYFAYWRDVDFDDLLGVHQKLNGLVISCSTAFGHPIEGGMLLKTSMKLSEALARLTMTLSRRPDLTRRLQSTRAAGDGDRKTIAETSAETIQRIFTLCLNDRSSGRYSLPEGKKVGIYMFTNLVLKLLFACRRTQLAKNLLANVANNAPPLSFYPAAQRVTFLYYLGRFYFSNNHFLRAANCLQEAYLQTPPPLVSHRVNILTYLIPSNLLLGRFPSAELLRRPECRELGPIFQPLCAAVRSGNFVAFQHHLAAHETWLFERGLLLPLTHRLRPLLWRSLSRRTFLLTYVPPDDASSRLAATLDLADLHTVAVYLQRRLEGWLLSGLDRRPKSAHVNQLLMKAVKNNVQDPGNTTVVPPPGGPKKLRPNEGMIWGNAEVTFDDVEMTVASLVEQDFMHGFVAHGQRRFAIIGAKAKGPVVAGWPNVWQAIRERRQEDDFDPDETPGWVKGDGQT